MQELTDRFEAARPRLIAIARRVAGPAAAEDVVQDAWLRLAGQREPPDNLDGWLTTVTARIAVDHLRRRHVRDEPWDIDVVRLDATVATPEDHVLLADAVGAALAVVVDRLSPAERIALLLHDVFGVPFADIASALGRTEGAVKMLASRARRRVESPGTDALEPEIAVVRAFLDAARGGDLDRLAAVLAPDVTLFAHFPGASVAATGRDAVAGRARMAASVPHSTEFVLVGSAVGVVSWAVDGAAAALLAFTVLDGVITAVESWNHPDWLAAQLAPSSGPVRPRPEPSRSRDRGAT